MPGKPPAALLTDKQAFCGKELEYLPRTDDFADAFRADPVFLACQQFGSHGVPDVEALLDGALRPGRESPLRCRDGRFGLRLVRLGVVANDLIDVRWISTTANVAGAHPFAGNKVGISL
jgi:hypothetical protein